MVSGPRVRASEPLLHLIRDTATDAERLRPLTKLGGDEWGTLGEILHLNRIPFEEPRGE